MEITRKKRYLEQEILHQTLKQLQKRKTRNKVIIPPPKILKEIEDRLVDESLEKVNFYLAKNLLIVWF